MDGSRHLTTVDFFGTPLSLPALLDAVIILVVTVVSAIVLRVLIVRHSRRQEGIHAATWYTLSRLVSYTVLVAGALLAISALGLPLSQFSILAGAVGVGLGFGLQSLFANFISGVVLLLDKSLKVGDFVELESGVTGEVRDIKIRATAIATNDNIDILVPNSEFINGRVVNWTHREALRRIHVPFGVAYGTDKNLVKTAALEAAASVPFTLELDGARRPHVWLTGFGESSLNFELVIWIIAEATKKPAAVTAAYNWALHSALQAHGIVIPFPQRDLNVRTLFGLSDEDARAALRLAAVGGRSEGEAPSSQGIATPAVADDSAVDSSLGDAGAADSAGPDSSVGGAARADSAGDDSAGADSAGSDSAGDHSAGNDAIDDVKAESRVTQERRTGTEES